MAVSSMFGIYVLERCSIRRRRRCWPVRACCCFGSELTAGGEWAGRIRAAGGALLVGLIVFAAFLVYFQMHGAGFLQRRLTGWRAAEGWRGFVGHAGRRIRRRAAGGARAVGLVGRGDVLRAALGLDRFHLYAGDAKFRRGAGAIDFFRRDAGAGVYDAGLAGATAGRGRRRAAGQLHRADAGFSRSSRSRQRRRRW